MRWYNGSLKVLGLILAVLGSLCARGQEEEIGWMSLAEAERQALQQPKPLLIDVYTDWCGWCKQMDKTTYDDPLVISFVNRYFYPVKLNAESADTVYFRNKVYAPVVQGNKLLNSLAVELLGGKLSYPTTVFLYDSERVNLVVPGYIDIPKMQGFMIYFAENVYLSTDINTFLGDFVQVFGKEYDRLPLPKAYWTTFEELEARRKEQARKILLFMKASWSNSSKMMEKTVFTDSVFSSLAQKYFYCLHLDVQSTDSLTFMTHHFVNSGSQNNYLHQLAIALSDKVLRVPGIFLFDENGKLIERLYYYLDRRRGSMILDYIGSDLYKDMAWSDYVRMRSKECL